MPRFETEGPEGAQPKPNRSDFSQWLQRGPNTFMPADNAKTVTHIPAGFYSIRNTREGFYLFKKDPKTDELISLPFDETQEVISSIDEFWTLREKFDEYGFTYKRGILLYGPPGTGKTSLINMICKILIEKMNGIVFTITDTTDLECYGTFVPEIFRIIEPTRPILTIIEDIDGLCESKSVETDLINMLDGIEQLDNVVYIATTNFAEKLSKRLLNRPNRFDKRVYVGYPTPKVRLEYIKFKLKESDRQRLNLKEMVELTKGLTISHIGEFIKLIVLFNKPMEEAIKQVKEINEKLSSHEYDKEDYARNKKSRGTSLGFNNRKVADEEEEIDWAGEEDYDHVYPKDDIEGEEDPGEYEKVPRGITDSYSGKEINSSLYGKLDGNDFFIPIR